MEAHAAAGHVFCGLGEYGTGEYLAISGGSCKQVRGFSGDEQTVVFEVTHDGVAEVVTVQYNTRAD